jgi:hypothetical protein
LTCEDVILHKLLAGRVLDRSDVGHLLRLNVTNLDRGYLTKWANYLGLTNELALLWEEAIPGEKL